MSGCPTLLGMARSLHPDDARKRLRAYARRRQTAEERVRALAGELPDLIVACRAAGLSMTEIARLAGISRSTVHDAHPPTREETRR